MSQVHAQPARMAARLCEWYDANARELPWRMPPDEIRAGRRPDPYRVWLSEILLQQTTVPHARRYFDRFVERWPTVDRLAAASWTELSEAWAGLGYYSRARNLHRCAAELAARGSFPSSYEDWLGLPGVGPYTAAAVCAIAFGRRKAPIDGNLERVFSRVFMIGGDGTPAGKRAAMRRLAEAGERVFMALEDDRHAGDLAQSLMDLGARVCTPRLPQCHMCPLRGECRAEAESATDRFPVRVKRAPKQVRRGRVFIVTDAGGRTLAVRRPSKGLLGGMLMPPGDDWTEQLPPDSASGAPVAADWKRAGRIRHVFTHFTLDLDVWAAEVREADAPPPAEWLAVASALAAFPSCGAKALRAALERSGSLPLNAL